MFHTGPSILSTEELQGW